MGEKCGFSIINVRSNSENVFSQDREGRNIHDRGQEILLRLNTERVRSIRHISCKKKQIDRSMNTLINSFINSLQTRRECPHFIRHFPLYSLFVSHKALFKLTIIIILYTCTTQSHFSYATIF
jgi:hypothetical protein